MRTSLREWAKENKIWEPKAWRTFLEEDLVPFYKQAFTLNVLFEFLKSEKICGKSSLADIEDETLKNKIRVAIYGGVDPNKDFNTSFAKFMYDNFGICAENAPSFEESIKYYENFGDGVKVSVNPNSWINSILIGNLVDELKSLIQIFCDKLNIKLSEISIQESYPYPPSEVIEPDALLPSAGEKPEKLVSLINDFRQKALNLSRGVNPFTTFVFYSRAIPLPVLMEFLECDIDEVTKLANFLGLKAYSMIDQTEVSLPTRSPDKVILIWEKGKHYEYPSFFERLLGLQSFLHKIDPTIKQVYENMIKQAMDQIHITFEPWEDYESIFSFLADALRDGKSYVECFIKRGKLIGLRTYTKDRYRGYPIFKDKHFKKSIPLHIFWIKIYPIVSAGILDFIGTEFELSLYAKEWIDKVIENEGKT